MRHHHLRPAVIATPSRFAWLAFLLFGFVSLLPGVTPHAMAIPPVTFTITASAGPNGSISPNGAVIVNQGASQSFTITADPNYHVDNVTVDGVLIGPAVSYPFNNVQANHTISATFAIDTYSITTSAGANGSIVPGGVVIADAGSDASFDIVPDAHYHIANVILDGSSLGAVPSVTLNDIATNHTLSATFAIDTYTITATAGANGDLSPNGVVIVNYGSDPVFTMQPDANYHVQDVLVDNASVGGVSSYTFSNVSANHSISVTFAIDTHTLTISTVGSGSVSRSPNAAQYAYGTTVTLTALPSPGWVFAAWSGDASGTTSPLDVLVTGNLNITATFALINSGLSIVTINDVHLAEGNTGTRLATFTVTVSPPAASAVQLKYVTQGISASALDDYVAASGTLAIPASTASVPLSVVIKGDTKFEGDETFRLRLSQAVGAVLSDSVGLGTIDNDDALPVITIADASTTEGNSGARLLKFVVTLSNPSASTVKVDYTTLGVTATTSNSDYAGASGTLSIAAGSTSGSIYVTVYGDPQPEPNETFELNLTSPTGATIGDALAIGTILNDDSGTALPALRISDVSKTEGNNGTKSFDFTVTLSAASSAPVTVKFATSGVTASVYGRDYVGRNGTLTIPANTLAATISVQVKGDTKVEKNETFVVNLSSPTNAVLGDAQGVGTISNDDGGHAVAATPPGDETLATSSEDQEGESSSTGIATVSLALGSNPVRGALAVQLSLPEDADVRVSVIDAQGRFVDELANGRFTEGRHTLRATARSASLAPGMYFVRVETAGQNVVRKFVTIR